jgi:DNA-binding transcriptional ArsR family regulator
VAARGPGAGLRDHLRSALRSCKIEPLGAMRYVAVAQAGLPRPILPKRLDPHNFSSLPFVAFNRKDDLQAEFVADACGLKHVSLRHLYVPSSEGQLQAVLAGWGVSVLPELMVRAQLEQGTLVNLMPGHSLPVALFWHCWNLNSVVLDALTHALKNAALSALSHVEVRRKTESVAHLHGWPIFRRTGLRWQHEYCTPTKVSFKQRMLQVREDTIVQTVNRLLAEKGFDAMTVDEVAAQVGIAKASLYKHFPSKEDLAAAAMVRVMRQAQDMICRLADRCCSAGQSAGGGALGVAGQARG